MDHNRNSIYTVMMNFKILIFANQFNSRGIKLYLIKYLSHLL